jgi:UDP-N-acetylmuramyl-tripeptide synthetase
MMDALNFMGITADSRLVKPGYLFLAYPGVQSDGRDYIAQAIEAGAIGVIFDDIDFTWQEKWTVWHRAVRHLKQVVGDIAADFYQQPSGKLNVVGITGTNGKTSVSHWLAQSLTYLGEKTAVLGTVGNGFLNATRSATNTTPDAILLQAMLAEYLALNAQTVVMEVSSHGLDQGRVNGVEFDVAVLTNLSRDHLDYHGSMEAYAQAKQKLFSWPSLKCAVINADDAFGQRLLTALKAESKATLSYGFSDEADLHASHLRLHESGLSMQVSYKQRSVELQAPVLGRFNAYNVLAVLSGLLALGNTLESALPALAKLQSVTGRMQQFGGEKLPLVVVDYAHTPDALEKVLITLREQATGQLICLFGCGGERDAGKRPLMGAIASQLADRVVLTSDNPRGEAPDAIIAEIMKGMHGHYQVEADRAMAINLAIHSAMPGDIVLLAGKGHESYQEVAGVKQPFDDALMAKRALETHPKSLAKELSL